MANGLVARIADRIVANARVVKEAPEALAFLGIMTLGLSFLVLQEFHRERLAALNDRIASQEVMLGEYRTKLKGATPEQAADFRRVVLHQRRSACNGPGVKTLAFRALLAANV